MFDKVSKTKLLEVAVYYWTSNVCSAVVDTLKGKKGHCLSNGTKVGTWPQSVLKHGRSDDLLMKTRSPCVFAKKNLPR